MSLKNKIFIVALTVLIIIFGVYFVCVNKPSESTDGITMSLNTSTWKNYTNKACGFSFSYPSEAVLSPTETKVVGVTTSENLIFQQNQEGEVPPFYYVYVSCLEDLPTLITNHGDNFNRPKESIKTLEDFFSANTLSVIKYIGNTEIDGQVAFKSIVGIDNSYSLWFDRDGVIFQLTFSSYQNAGEIISPIQQGILDSFKFTE